MRKTILTITITLITSCTTLQPIEEETDAVAQAADAVPSVRTIKVAYLPPFVGSFAAPMRPVISWATTDENFPGYVAPVGTDNGAVIVGARAWVRVVSGSTRLTLGTNTQTVGADPGNAGLVPQAQSAASTPGTAVQLLSISGQHLTVVAGTSYWLHVGAVSPSGTSGLVQLGGLELDLSTALTPAP